MFYGQRLVDLPDGKPKWTGINGDSDLIEDSPAEAIEEHKRNMEKKKREEEKEKRQEGHEDKRQKL
jgi:hypothetical protein